VSKRLLIATLGTSPAVITEALDLLKEEGCVIDGVKLLMTQDHDVQSSFEILAEHIPSHYKIRWIHPVYTDQHTDVDSTEAAVGFLEAASQELRMASSNGYDAYVCLAGGRKIMSSLLALAAQLFGAARLFHVWVPEWTANEGHVSKLVDSRNDPDKINRLLHPPAEPDSQYRPRLVDLPFVGLFPLLPEIVSGLRGNKVGEAVTRLLQNGLLGSDQRPTASGNRLLEILQSVESLPPARSGQVQKQLSKSEPKYSGFLNDRAEQFAAEFPFVTRIEDIQWRQGDDKVKIEEPNALRVYLQVPGESHQVGLRLVTTASTKGQLEAARKAVERFIRNR
jgi:CRISPR-associated protein Csx14